MSDLKLQLSRPETVDKFKTLYVAVHKSSKDEAAQQYELEKFNFLNEIATKGYNDVTQVSAMGVFLDVMSMGLSFNKSLNHVYIMTRSTRLPNGQYEKRLVYQVQADGKEFLAQSAGVIKRTTKPVVVYEGDTFEQKTNEQGDMVIVYARDPQKRSQKIVGGFIYITYPDNTKEPFWMEETDIARLMGYSAKQNGSRGANALYSSFNGGIDPGFLKTKLMTHALNHIGKAPIKKTNEVDDDFVEEVRSEAVNEMKYETKEEPATENDTQFINEENSNELAF
jgi:hypothetical protein